MSDVDQTTTFDLDEPHGRSPLVKWGLIGLVALALLGAGGAVWYFFLGGRAHFSPQPAKEVEAPLPYYLEVKPIVVSMPSAGGTTHFVQVGVSLQLPRPAAGEMIGALLPEVQDAMRQTLLTFKSDDLQTPEGVDKVRKAMIEHLNESLASVLGPDRMAKLTAGSPNGAFVQNILFPTLIVE
jgi:flagellar basal body-associated protein FliL